jgi:hypothetical protein
MRECMTQWRRHCRTTKSLYTELLVVKSLRF